MPKKQQDYEDSDYEPDTDTPDTSEADQMLEEGLNTESGIGHSKLIQHGEQEFAKANAEQAKQNDARASAAKSLKRDTED